MIPIGTDGPLATPWETGLGILSRQVRTLISLLSGGGAGGEGEKSALLPRELLAEAGLELGASWFTVRLEASQGRFAPPGSLSPCSPA